jgi:hypothetical protein
MDFEKELKKLFDNKNLKNFFNNDYLKELETMINNKKFEKDLLNVLNSLKKVTKIDFKKMKGDMKHNSQLKVKGTALKILASENTKTSFLKFKLFLISLLGLNYAFQGAAIRCMLYYLNKKKRKKYEVDKVFVFNSKYGLNEEIIREKIALKYPNKKNNDMYVLYGYDFLNRGSETILAKEKIIRFLQRHLDWSLKNNNKILNGRRLKKVELSEMKTFKQYEHIYKNHVGNGIFGKDFYFALGDNNYLCGIVNHVDEKKRKFNITFMIFGEYNWDRNYTYFIKIAPLPDYDIVIETDAFFKYEKEGEAAPFISVLVKSMKNLDIPNFPDIK